MEALLWKLLCMVIFDGFHALTITWALMNSRKLNLYIFRGCVFYCKQEKIIIKNQVFLLGFFSPFWKRKNRLFNLILSAKKRSLQHVLHQDLDTWSEAVADTSLCCIHHPSVYIYTRKYSSFTTQYNFPFSFSHRWNTELQLWQYSLLGKVYFLVNFQNSHWGNTGKYTPSRAGSILTLSVLAQLYWEHIFQYWPSSRLWRGSFENLPLGWLLMSPLNFLSTRSYKIWPRISSSAMGYKGIG